MFSIIQILRKRDNVAAIGLREIEILRSLHSGHGSQGDCLSGSCSHIINVLDSFVIDGHVMYVMPRMYSSLRLVGDNSS